MEKLDYQSAALIPVSLGGDMSASRRSVAYFIGDATAVTLEAVWPATGSPVGAFKLEGLNDPSLAAGGVLPIFSNADVVAGQPSGTAGSLRVDRIRTGFAYVCVTYTATSGGTGATPVVTLSLKRS